MRTTLLPLVSFLVLVTAAAPALADDRVSRVGVVIGVTVNVEPDVADTVGAALATALAAELKVDAIGGAEVTRRLPPGGLDDECVSTPACLADLGQRLAAGQLLFLGVVRVGTDYQIDATWVDVAAGTQAARPRVKLTDLRQAGEVFAGEATRFLPDAEVRGSTSQTVVVHTEGTRHRPIRKVVWVLGGVTVAGLATGVVLGLSAKSKYDGCNKPDGPFCTDSERDSIKTRALLSDVSFAVGIGAAVAAVVLYVKTPVEVLPVTPAVTPVAGGAVLTFDGRF